MKIIRTVSTFVLALGFASALAACGSNNCDKYADELDACYSSSECQNSMTCKAAADAAGMQMGGDAECNDVADAFAQACLGKLQASSDCACVLN